MRLSKAVAEFHRGYFATHQRSRHTKRAYAIDLDQFQKWLGDHSLLALTSDDLERWAAELKRRDYASASIRRKFATLRVFLGYWVRKGVLERSPLWMISLDLAPQRSLTKVLAVDEMRCLREEAHRQLIQGQWSTKEFVEPSDKAFLSLRNVALVEVLFATGIRVGELVALKLVDFRQSESTFIVQGKGSRQRMAFLPDQRSQDSVAAYARRRCQVQGADQSLFLNSRGRRLSTQGVSRTITRLAEGAGVSSRITPHVLRHTIATQLLRNGANLRVVQVFLGHSSIKTTERYTQVCREDLEVALRRFHPNMSGAGSIQRAG